MPATKSPYIRYAITGLLLLLAQVAVVFAHRDYQSETYIFESKTASDARDFSRANTAGVRALELSPLNG
jgi:hypothetical protein